MTEHDDRVDHDDRTEGKPQGQDVTAGKGRRDEVGRTGIYPATGPHPEGEAPYLRPGDINEPQGHRGPGAEFNEELRGSSEEPERFPRKGNEMDKPDSDRLGE